MKPHPLKPVSTQAGKYIADRDRTTEVHFRPD